MFHMVNLLDYEAKLELRAVRANKETRVKRANKV